MTNPTTERRVTTPEYRHSVGRCARDLLIEAGNFAGALDAAEDLRCRSLGLPRNRFYVDVRNLIQRQMDDLLGTPTTET